MPLVLHPEPDLAEKRSWTPAGLRSDFVLPDDMKDVAAFARFVTTQLKKVNLMNRPGKEFFKELRLDGEGRPLFIAPNGVFDYVTKRFNTDWDEVQDVFCCSFPFPCARMRFQIFQAFDL